MASPSKEVTHPPPPSEPHNSKLPQYSSGSDSESDTETTPEKQAEAEEESSDDDEEEEEEEEEGDGNEEEERTVAAEQPGQAKKPDKEKLKTAKASQTQSSGKSKSRPFEKVWSKDDELVLIDFLSDFHSKFKRPPRANEINLVYSSLDGKVSFHATEKQIMNKIRTFRDSFRKKRKKGIEITGASPHAKAVREISKKFWGDKSQVTEKAKNIIHNLSDDVVSNELMNWAKNDDEISSEVANQRKKEEAIPNMEVKYPYLLQEVEELRKGNPYMSTFYKDAFESLDKSKAGYFEAKFKKQKHDEAVLSIKKREMTIEVVKAMLQMGG